MKSSLLGFGVLSALVGAGWAHPQAQGSSNQLPVVDLEYELHQANNFNEDRKLYNFSNIRYAAPPVGDLRFKAPEYPASDRSGVSTGSEGKICPQALARWSATSGLWLPTYIASGIIPPRLPIPDLTNPSGASLLKDPRQTEDCLFLDVLVPQAVFEKRSARGAPVVVALHGGGYSYGSKADLGDAFGLLNRSRVANEEVIYVAINYRLGAFGFLSGPSFQKDGLANAALHDQRFALEWVQRHISKFGGDKNRVTLLGESSGGGSILHQITAFGGLRDVPFSSAVLQSPAVFPNTSPKKQEDRFNDLLREAKVGSLDELRKLPSVDLQSANRRDIAASPYGVFKYGPSPDGFFVPADPKTLLNHGQFARNVRTLGAHNTNEGLLFTPPLLTNLDFLDWARDTFRYAQPDVLSYITETLYPNRLDGSYGYRDHVARAALIISESTFTCNTVGLAGAYDNNTYNYLFSRSPGLHGQDNGHTYFVPGQKYSGGGGDTYIGNFPVNETAAFALQDYIVSFAAKGKPDSPVDGVDFPLYGDQARVVDIGSEVKEGRDPASNDRCRWWQLQLQN